MSLPIRCLMLTLCFAASLDTQAVMPEAKPPEKIVALVATAADPGQQYSLYLPAGYTAARRWPVLIVLDPRGRAEATLAMATPGARKHGWIVISSYQSRSDGLESITINALQALLREAGSRYAYDPKRVYLAGMSGTAKTLWTLQDTLSGLVAGTIGCGGGRPPELGRMTSLPPAFYGIAGTRDFNYQQMRDLDIALADKGSRHHLAIFTGEHGWPPDTEDFTAAIDWLELSAMRGGLVARDERFIDDQLAEARRRAADAADALARSRALDDLARDFDGLRDVGSDRATADTARSDPETKRLRAMDQRLRGEEYRQAQRLDAWLARFNQRLIEGRQQAPPDLGNTLMQLRIRSIQAQAKNPDAREADSAQRKLALAYAAAVGYLPRDTVKSGDLDRARTALQLATAIYPELPTGYCRLAEVEVGDNHPDAALDAMQSCLERGYGDREALTSDPVWAPLRSNPRWADLLSRLPRDD